MARAVQNGTATGPIRALTGTNVPRASSLTFLVTMRTVSSGWTSSTSSSSTLTFTYAESSTSRLAGRTLRCLALGKAPQQRDFHPALIHQPDLILTRSTQLPSQSLVTPSLCLSSLSRIRNRNLLSRASRTSCSWWQRTTARRLLKLTRMP